MPRYLTVFFSILTHLTFGQHNNELYCNGAVFHVSNGAEVHVNGDIRMMGATSFTNNGLVRTQGNSYCSNTMQQRGSGIYRIENSTVNTNEIQTLTGKWDVRGGQAQIGIDDGSFFDLELANDLGIVCINGNLNRVDVRNSVDFLAGSVHNRIVTHPNYSGNSTSPIFALNGTDHNNTFGLMNANPTGGLINSAVDVYGYMSGVDAGYIEGRFRRAIDPVGGSYIFPVGLEPAPAGWQMGIQNAQLDFGGNNYDVVEMVFQTISSNVIPGTTYECNGELVDYFGGFDHGEWFVEDITGSGSGTFSVRVWPQDHNFPIESIWLITENNGIGGTADECGPTYAGLTRSGFNGMGYKEYGVAAVTSPLSNDDILIQALGQTYFVDVSWQLSSNTDLTQLYLERSLSGIHFETVEEVDAEITTQLQQFSFADHNVQRDKWYFYRVKGITENGTERYSPVVKSRLDQGNEISLSVYPNPGTDQVTVSLENIEGKNLQFQVMNTLGQVMTEKQFFAEGNTAFHLNIMDWAMGMYYLQVKNENGEQIIIQKLIKQ